MLMCHVWRASVPVRQCASAVVQVIQLTFLMDIHKGCSGCPGVGSGTKAKWREQRKLAAALESERSEKAKAAKKTGKKKRAASSSSSSDSSEKPAKARKVSMASKALIQALGKAVHTEQVKAAASAKALAKATTASATSKATSRIGSWDKEGDNSLASLGAQATAIVFEYLRT